MSVPLSQSHGGKLGDCATSEAEWRRTAAREVRRPEVEAGRDLVVVVVGEVGQGERGEEGASVAVGRVGRGAEPKQRHRRSVKILLFSFQFTESCQLNESVTQASGKVESWQRGCQAHFLRI